MNIIFAFSAVKKQVRMHKISRSPVRLCPPSKSITDRRTNGQMDGHTLLIEDVRSAKGPGLELLETEIRRWAVQWDVVGLAETWLDAESEKAAVMEGFQSLCASRKGKGGGGVALFIKDGLTYRERPDLGTFNEGVFESLFIEVVRGGGRRNDIVGVVYRPPRGELGVFNDEMA